MQRDVFVLIESTPVEVASPSVFFYPYLFRLWRERAATGTDLNGLGPVAGKLNNFIRKVLISFESFEKTVQVLVKAKKLASKMSNSTKA